MYISKEEIKEIRNALKKEFPNVKFQVKKNHNGSSGIEVNILKSPYDFSDFPFFDPNSFNDINIYHMHMYKNCKNFEVLERILEIIKNGSERKWFNKSESQSDYFYEAFYIDLGIGNYDKGYSYEK